MYICINIFWRKHIKLIRKNLGGAAYEGQGWEEDFSLSAEQVMTNYVDVLPNQKHENTKSLES